MKRLDLTNLAASATVFAEDFVWHYYNPELPEIEGDYFGLSGLIDFFKILAGKTKSSFKVHPISITPMGDKLVITHVKDSMFLEDKPMEIDAIVVWCIVDSKIKEAWDIPVIHTAKMIETVNENL
ncbi:nuclear transport factor 2-like protein [Spongiivirga citrea]|uniref:nuclear transport factor 2 family protein n=1 Tax=Spongiivirga citrea TaxID=1481457 RepID=UPI001EF82975|nr:nuclear transport factor 2 family protein [Spongiivirga citrea]